MLGIFRVDLEIYTKIVREEVSFSEVDDAI
jgi:hypothetical protein